jgi:hypothetical protein
MLPMQSAGFVRDVYARRAASSTTRGYSSLEQGIAPQMSAGGFARASDVFSGSCGCGPGFCCCNLCYLDRCVFWCWLSGPIVGDFGSA